MGKTISPTDRDLQKQIGKSGSEKSHFFILKKPPQVGLTYLPIPVL